MRVMGMIQQRRQLMIQHRDGRTVGSIPLTQVGSYKALCTSGGNDFAGTILAHLGKIGQRKVYDDRGR